jgi:hypothetical protein
MPGFLAAALVISPFPKNRDFRLAPIIKTIETNLLEPTQTPLKIIFNNM